MLEIERIRIKNDQALELALFSSLNPVDPDPEFVGRLRDRFEQAPATVMEHHTFWVVYVAVASGLFVGIFLIWLAQHLIVRRQTRR